MPRLQPESCDLEASGEAQSSLLVDFAGPLQGLLHGRTQKVASVPQWRPSMKGDLASAISGGQWTQARRAAVPKWQISDVRCQLCHSAPGTLEHRHECPRTEPPEGWPPDPPKAGLALRTVGQVRADALRTRGLLIMQLPSPQYSAVGWFRWMVAPGPDSDERLTWYLDGSMHDGNYTEYRAVGFGIVVVAPDRSLSAYGHGVPPSWCKTAAAAEAWALHIALAESAFPPKLRTDCQSLLTTAREGAAQATGPDRPLARIWNLIVASLDGRIESIVEHGNLVWMPAHQPLNAIGRVTLSNGKLLSGMDWRANRLVDALAKTAADTMRAPKAVRCLLESGSVAVKHRAALLAVVTHVANSCKEPVQRPDGTWTATVRRDAQQPAGHTRRQRKQPRPPAEPAALPEALVPDPCKEGRFPSAHSGKRKRVVSAGRRRKRSAIASREGQPECRPRGKRSVHWPIAQPICVSHYKPPQVSSCSTSSDGFDSMGWPAVDGRRAVGVVLPGAHDFGRMDRPVVDGRRAIDMAALPDAREELLLLYHAGLKVAWPQEASRDAHASPVRSWDDPSCTRGKAARTSKAARTAPAGESSDAALLDLKSLHESGLKVVWLI